MRYAFIAVIKIWSYISAFNADEIYPNHPFFMFNIVHKGFGLDCFTFYPLI